MKTINRDECVSFIENIKMHFKENFPFLKDEDRDNFINRFDSLLEEEEFLEDKINIDNLIKRLQQIIVTLDNSHVDLSEKGKEIFKLNKELYYKAGIVWVDTDDEPLEVVSVNDTPISQLIDEEVKNIGGGTLEWKKYKAVNKIATSKQEYGVIITAKNGVGGEVKVDAEFEKNRNKRFKIKVENGMERSYKREDCLESKILEGNIGYIRIDSWSNAIEIDGKNIAQLVEEELEKIKSSTSIILDVRNNDGGNSHYARLVASHFIKEKTECCHFLVKKPGQKDMVKFTEHVAPEGEFYDKKIVILTGPICISSTDMFLTFLKDTGRAVSIGQTTGGGSGNPQSLDLHLGGRDFNLRVSCWRNYRNNGQEIENNGIEPDIFVEPRPDDIRKRRDVELLRAVKYLIDKSN
jgi:C-terminal processing protease CtpA/Prc